MQGSTGRGIHDGAGDAQYQSTPHDTRKIAGEHGKGEKPALRHPFFAGASLETIEQLPELSHQAVALKIYLNDTFGPLRMNEDGAVKRCFQVWKSDKPIALHAENEMIEMGINLAKDTGQNTHFCHVSRQKDIELIAKAKQDGAAVTCEVTPHHLFLNDKDARRLGPLGDMRPILGTQNDVDALWDHLNSTIDCIASDHAPHTLGEKFSAKCPPGVPGLETSFALMFSAVMAGKITQERLVELMAVNPRKIYGIAEEADSWIEVDADCTYKIDNDDLYTKCKWSPFSGRKVTGKIIRVVRKNRPVFESGNFLVWIDDLRRQVIFNKRRIHDD